MKNAREIASWIIAVIGVSFSAYFVFFIGKGIYTKDEWALELLKSNPKLSIFLPIAAIGSYAIVTLLEYQSGAIKFEMGKFKFEGAAGSIIFWIISFIAISLMIKMM